MDDARGYRLGLLLITLSAIAWSTAGLFTRVIAMDSWVVLAWRGLFGGLGIMAFLLLQRRSQLLSDLAGLGRAGWLYAVICAVAMLLFVRSLHETSVAHVAIIYATVPFQAGLLAWLAMAERPSWSAMLASGIALLGVLITVAFAAGEGSLLGDALALAMTLLMAILIVLARKTPTLPLLPAAATSALLSGLLAWPFGAPLDVTWSQACLLAAFGLVNSSLGFGLFALGSRYLPAMETALLGSLEAPLAAVWVWLILSETPGIATLVGGSIVFVAVLAHLLHEGRRAPGA